jgi:hypothetical protein
MIRVVVVGSVKQRVELLGSLHLRRKEEFFGGNNST